MRNEHKSRAGKYDHVKPLPYKRFHPEVLNVIYALLFYPGFADCHCAKYGGLGGMNTKLFSDGYDYTPAGLCAMFGDVTESEASLLSGLQRIGYNHRKFPRLSALAATYPTWVRMRDLYPLIEADLRQQGVLGRIIRD